MTMSPVIRRKIYLAFAITAAICLTLTVIIWHQFGRPSSPAAAQIYLPKPSSQSATPSASPAASPQATSPSMNHVGYTGDNTHTALQLLQRLYPSTITKGDGVNQVVVSIEGHPTSTESTAWVFYINNSSALVGPASYTPTPSDQIDWRLETFN